MSLARTLAEMRRQAAHRIGRQSTRAADAIDVDALADDIRRDIGLPERTELPSRWRLSGRELVGLWMRGHKL